MTVLEKKSAKEKSLAQQFSEQWLKAAYGSAKWIYIFYPLSLIFFLVTSLRRFLLVQFFQHKLCVPVVVVGNISLGGTGKTPLLMALVNYFISKNKKVGVVSRGYGSKAPHYPYLLNEQSTAIEAGDEPFMIYQATGAMVCVAPERRLAAQYLIDQGCNIILSDDGLQHYALARDAEILVVDAARKFGNQQLIPAGPLREPLSRLKKVSAIFINTTTEASAHFKKQLSADHSSDVIVDFNLDPDAFVQIKTGKTFKVDEFVAIQMKAQMNSLSAIAAIGNPAAFFSSLNRLGLTPETKSFEDHHQFCAEDFSDLEGVVIMTEKDAVKVKSFAKDNWYYLKVNARIDSTGSAFLEKLFERTQK